MAEVLGFWILFAGWLLLIVSGACAATKRTLWIEEKLCIPWYAQIFAPALAVILMLVGWHVWCIGNRGRYPGYPLDVLIEWFR